MPKNICLKQQENNRLEEEECLIEGFLEETIAVLFRFRSQTERVIARLLESSGELREFVKAVIAEREWFKLKTVALVEVLGGLEVAEVIEGLERKEREEEDKRDKGG